MHDWAFRFRLSSPHPGPLPEEREPLWRKRFVSQLFIHAPFAFAQMLAPALLNEKRSKKSLVSCIHLRRDCCKLHEGEIEYIPSHILHEEKSK